MSRKSTNLPAPAEAFLKAGLYLRNWRPWTIQTYRQGLASLYFTITEPVPSKAQLDRWVMTMRQQGLTSGGCNVRIRTVNSFLSWLHEEGLIAHPLKVQLLRAPQRQLMLLSTADVRALLIYKPRTAAERRTWTLILLLLDTGLRIDEALGLERARLNLDDMLLIVMGKGAKERQVPFSPEMRKILFRWLCKSEIESKAPYLFTTRNGNRMTYRNVYRDIHNICKRIGVRVHVHPHLFRHQFAATYIRQGGDIYRLSRLL